MIKAPRKSFLYGIGLEKSPFLLAGRRKPGIRFGIEADHGMPRIYEGNTRDVLARFLYQQYINAPDSIFNDVL